MAISFFICLMFFLVIGLSSARVRKNTQQDYYLASHSVSPWLAGLSAVTTNNSGYMFIGVIGYTYAVGLSASVLMVGWILGDLLASLWVHKKLRAVSVEQGESSYIATLGAWGGLRQSWFRPLAAAIALVFLLAYAGAQLVASSKALQVLLDWPTWLSASLGALLVMLYCMAGGIRASIWTDAAQSLVMMLAMGIMLVSAFNALGGVEPVYQAMSAIDGFLSLEAAAVVLPGAAGVMVFFIGWLVAGFAVIAQPHIMVRFMALSSAEGFVRARLWYYLWFIVFYVMATGVGMLSRIYLADAQHFDAELALPSMAVELLPPLMVGLVLAGIFAATISTADSLLLSCSAFLSQDLLPRLFGRAYGMKVATLLATLAALAWALFNRQSVFALVVLSWAMLAACFVPLILVLLLGSRPRGWQAVLMMLTGCGAVLALHLAGVSVDLFFGLPAILLALLVYWCAVRLSGYWPAR